MRAHSHRFAIAISAKARLGRLNLLFWLVVLATGVIRPLPAFAQGFYAIAHMTNSTAAVDWALAQGANAVEIDLQFDSTGKATVFHHGSPCDCACAFAYGLCRALSGVCSASTNAPDLLQHLAAKSGVALVVIDSKISGSDAEAKQKQAGASVAQLLATSLFERGYPGRVVVSAASLQAITYVAAVASGILESHRPRVYFTIDQANDVVPTIQTLIDKVPSTNRLYATGSSACSPTQYYSGVALAAKNVRAGVIGLVYNWTIDSTSTMEQYLANGTNGIMTNDPKALVDLLKAKQITLATPQSAIPAATSTNVMKQ